MEEGCSGQPNGKFLKVKREASAQGVEIVLPKKHRNGLKN